MTISKDIDDAVALATALSDLLLVRGGPRGQPASTLRRTVAAFQANLETGYRRQTLGPTIAALFDVAVAAGVSAAAFRDLRRQATDAAAGGIYAAWTRRSFRRQALIAETRRFATLNFTSRDDVDAARAALTIAFDELIDDASEIEEFEIMRDLTALFGAIQRHLLTTAVPLPRVITYSTPESLPSLVLAHRLYADASRRLELEQENHVRHPLFMPSTGKALAS